MGQISATEGKNTSTEGKNTADLSQNHGCFPFSDLILGVLSYFYPNEDENYECSPQRLELENRIHVGMFIDEIKKYYNNELIENEKKKEKKEKEEKEVKEVNEKKEVKKGNNANSKDLDDYNELKKINKYIAEFFSILENEKKYRINRDNELKTGTKNKIIYIPSILKKEENSTIDENTINANLEELFDELRNKIIKISSEEDKEDAINFYRFIDKVVKNIKNRISKDNMTYAPSVNSKSDGIGSKKDKQDLHFSTINDGLIIHKISGLVENLGQSIGADELLELNFYRNLEDIFKNFIKSIKERNYLCRTLYRNPGFADLEIDTNGIDKTTESIKNLTNCINNINNSSIFKDDPHCNDVVLLTRDETNPDTGETKKRKIENHKSFLRFLINSLADMYKQIINEITRVDREIGIIEGMGNTFLDNNELFKALEELHGNIMTYANKVVGDEHFKIKSDFRNEKTQELNEISIPENREIIVMRGISRIKNLLKNPDHPSI